MEKEINVIGVIPARYNSTRLPHKLLQSLCGKTVLQWTWESASGARLLDKLIIASDHPEIEKEAKRIGAKVVNTSSQHTSGTDRIAEAVRDIDTKFVINIQADEPLIHPSIIDSLAQEMLSDKTLSMATVKKRIEDKREIESPDTVKVVCDKLNFAIYFSRLPIPYYRQENKNTYYKHLGIYSYTKDFLYTFKNLPSSNLEKAEKLEQLRAIEAGYKIKVIETHFDSYGVDTEEDLYRVERMLMEKGYA